MFGAFCVTLHTFGVQVVDLKDYVTLKRSLWCIDLLAPIILDGMWPQLYGSFSLCRRVVPSSMRCIRCVSLWRAQGLPRGLGHYRMQAFVNSQMVYTKRSARIHLLLSVRLSCAARTEKRSASANQTRVARVRHRHLGAVGI